MAMKEFNYTAPPVVGQFMRSDAFHRAIMGPIGCVSADTEFLTPGGWKRIDQYQEGDLVAQWHENGRMDFVMPLRYVNMPCDELIWFRNQSLSMQLSEEHRVPVYDWAGNFRVKTAERLEKKPSRHVIPTTFSPTYSDAPVSDAELRLAVAINADGCHPKAGNQTIICVRKDRKKERLRELLPAAGVDYYERCYENRPTEVSFVFQRGYTGKTFEGWHWWRLSQRQLRIVIEEMSHWDGLYEGPETRFSSANKQDADYIQYATHAIGGKATIHIQTYDKPNWRPNYYVHIAMPGSVKAVATLRVDSVMIDRVPTEDGRKYCFTVPTGFFLMRHNGCVVVTGNSGKSAGCCVEILRRNLEMPAWNTGKRSSKWAIIRNTNKQLRDTTLATWMHWMRDLGTWHDSKMTFRLKFGEVDSEILFLPLDTPDDVGRVLSLELTGAFINEFREIPVSLLADIKGRLRRYPNPVEVPGAWYGLISDTNPPEVDSAAYNLMEHLPQEEGNPNSVIVCDTFKQPSGLSPDAENRDHLHPDYYSDLAKGQTKAWVDTYIHGLYSPSMLGKPVYANTFRADRHVSPTPLKIDPSLPVGIGFDTGLTPAAVFKQMGLDGRVRVLREAAAFDMGMKRFVTNYLRPIIKNFFPNNPLIFIGDPAGSRRADSDESSAFKVLKEAFGSDGAKVRAAYTNDPDVRIQATEQMLCQYPDGDPLMLIDPSCKRYIEGLRSKYRYPKLRQSGNFADRPEKNDWGHLIEAGQYLDMFLLSGKYDPSDYVTFENFNPLDHTTTYRPAQREGY